MAYYLTFHSDERVMACIGVMFCFMCLVITAWGFPEEYTDA
jgi:hypothetical protein